jgi:predicted nucleic acid-binding Zn ribbon protein
MRPLNRQSAEPVGDVLKRWIKHSGVLRTSERDRIWAVWERLLGPDAAHTRLAGLAKHVLTIEVDSSALLMDLSSFKKQEILEAIRDEVRSYFIRDIRFRLQKTA